MNILINTHELTTRQRRVISRVIQEYTIPHSTGEIWAL